MRVAYVTVYDARDPDGFNGSGYWIARCMQRRSIEVDFLGPLDLHARLRVAAKTRLYEKLLRQQYSRYRDTARVRGYAREITDILAARPADVVVSGSSPGSQPIAYLPPGAPVAVWTDATFAEASRQKRENIARLCRESYRDALRNEAAAMARADLLLYRSDWAARSAIEHYDVDPQKVHVLPLGPQLEIEHDAADVETMVDARPADTCRLLLCGTKWRQKGADIAVETVRILNAQGLPTRLDVVGARPPAGTSLPESVVAHGILRKGVPDELATLCRLYRDAHLFLMPTRAEAFGIVYTEASAFGVPSLATDVGGVASAVRDGVNGRLFPLEATPAEYAAAVLEILADRDRYRVLALSSFGEYQARFDWDVIGSRLQELLERVVQRECRR